MSKKTYFIVSLLVSLLSVLSVYYKYMERLDAGLFSTTGNDNASAPGLGLLIVLVIILFVTVIFHLALHAFLFYYVMTNKRYNHIKLSIIYIRKDSITLNVIRIASYIWVLYTLISYVNLNIYPYWIYAASILIAFNYAVWLLTILNERNKSQLAT
ncbi:hypothetical protein YDYSY3_47500 [Paenibacillus chitinolyticus]|uniref:hypothetical protein n=1 Tax=Paenibacillus chitinolyticus TaxID=79263 RepID=UPI0026E4C44F|nr:hypothetical protein [Paenibacillus chitinolyticus]GKS13750.1 hypothetical protein YDYSY3_47500 [Paenibacillus chitinolyticus]